MGMIYCVEDEEIMCELMVYALMLESGDFNHSESIEINQSESI